MGSEQIKSVCRCPRFGAGMIVGDDKECRTCQEEIAVRAGTPRPALDNKVIVYGGPALVGAVSLWIYLRDKIVMPP